MRRSLGHKTGWKKKSALPLLLSSLLVIIFFKFNPLTIQKVDINTGNIDCLNSFNSQKELNLIGQNIFFTNENELIKKLIVKYPCVKDITIKKESFNKVSVSFLPRTPLVYVSDMIVESSPSAEFAFLTSLQEATPSSTTALLDWSFVTREPNGSLVADKDGWIFKQSTRDQSLNQGNLLNLPLLFLTDYEIRLGKQIKNDILSKVVLVLAKLPPLGIEINNIKMLVQNDDLLVSSNPKLVFSLRKDTLKQLISLQLILQKAKIDEKVAETVDLRFDKPVIKFVKKAHG